MSEPAALTPHILLASVGLWMRYSVGLNCITGCAGLSCTGAAALESAPCFLAPAASLCRDV